MKKLTVPNKESVRSIMLIACVIALAAVSIMAGPQTARADDFPPPPVPENLQVPAGSKLFFQAHATGTQDYICLPSTSAPGYAWSFLRPEATLFDGDNEQVATHFLSPNPYEPSSNPYESGTPRAAWQDSRDTSIVWAKMIESAAVTPGAIPWFKLAKVNTQAGPNGGDRLTKTTFIQRVNTTGGLAPSTGCTQAGDVGKKAFVPYTADYYFYK